MGITSNNLLAKMGGFRALLGQINPNPSLSGYNLFILA